MKLTTLMAALAVVSMLPVPGRAQEDDTMKTLTELQKLIVDGTNAKDPCPYVARMKPLLQKLASSQEMYEAMKPVLASLGEGCPSTPPPTQNSRADSAQRQTANQGAQPQVDYANCVTVENDAHNFMALIKNRCNVKLMVAWIDSASATGCDGRGGDYHCLEIVSANGETGTNAVKGRVQIAACAYPRAPEHPWGGGKFWCKQ